MSRQRCETLAVPSSEIRELAVDVVAAQLADFWPVGQSVFCQGWQLCVKNAVSLCWIATT
jgi:hypothetical protein